MGADTVGVGRREQGAATAQKTLTESRWPAEVEVSSLWLEFRLNRRMGGLVVSILEVIPKGLYSLWMEHATSVPVPSWPRLLLHCAKTSPACVSDGSLGKFQLGEVRAEQAWVVLSVRFE